MKFARLGPLGQEIPAIITPAGVVRDIRSITADVDGAFLAGDGLAEVARAARGDQLPTLATEGVRYGAPIARPTKVVCIGLNYSDHAAETNAAIPSEPVVFMKDPSTVLGPFDEVPIPKDSQKTDWEVELGVVIGKTARYLASPAAAADVIGGYVLSHDVSEREFQLERGGTWDKGKSCEGFNPLGPWLVTPDEVGDPQALALSLAVNGIPRQKGTTANQIFSVAHVVWYLSQVMVLRPGDLINTGTPAGVAMGAPGQPYLRAGDVVELAIERLGASRQVFVGWQDYTAGRWSR
ncbi:MAG TPA: 2-hydroxyhepta-2,4-diene-1,7-dioate isomerase [Propionibacteriaceae bacterium]|nr:fumarylacetoacetate hydrolase family protein [Micropruina sp.]HBX81070.1 2-hydroxyhepta-2,4-diene-1,7-dioate isomerase [Propionibacteriaceae bacterium]HBY24708.1 2-hydroxyhepta-2,4-diene-1,7-dioate isomerase [Propionibacteriaceae bacterium]